MRMQYYSHARNFCRQGLGTGLYSYTTKALSGAAKQHPLGIPRVLLRRTNPCEDLPQIVQCVSQHHFLPNLVTSRRHGV